MYHGNTEAYFFIYNDVTRWLRNLGDSGTFGETTEISSSKQQVGLQDNALHTIVQCTESYCLDTEQPIKTEFDWSFLKLYKTRAVLS